MEHIVRDIAQGRKHGQMVRSSVHVITDSLLAHIKLGEEQRLAKNPAMLLPLEPKTTKLIERPSLQSRVKISQNSISGLRGFGGWSMGNDRRSQAFKTVQEQIMNGTTPEAVFVILGINDIRTVDRKDKDKPGVMVERILEFFWELRQLLPNSRVVWCSIGNLWRDHKAFDFHKQCQVFLESTNGLFPEWLQFLQLSGDATDTDIKDRHGHWTDQYAERIGNRILDLIESFIAETDNTPREDGITAETAADLPPLPDPESTMEKAMATSPKSMIILQNAHKREKTPTPATPPSADNQKQPSMILTSRIFKKTPQGTGQRFGQRATPFSPAGAARKFKNASPLQQHNGQRATPSTALEKTQPKANSNKRQPKANAENTASKTVLAVSRSGGSSGTFCFSKFSSLSDDTNLNVNGESLKSASPENERENNVSERKTKASKKLAFLPSGVTEQDKENSSRPFQDGKMKESSQPNKASRTQGSFPLTHPVPADDENLSTSPAAGTAVLADAPKPSNQEPQTGCNPYTEVDSHLRSFEAGEAGDTPGSSSQLLSDSEDFNDYTIEDCGFITPGPLAGNKEATTTESWRSSPEQSLCRGTPEHNRDQKKRHSSAGSSNKIMLEGCDSAAKLKSMQSSKFLATPDDEVNHISTSSSAEGEVDVYCSSKQPPSEETQLKRMIEDVSAVFVATTKNLKGKDAYILPRGMKRHELEKLVGNGTYQKLEGGIVYQCFKCTAERMFENLNDFRIHNLNDHERSASSNPCRLKKPCRFAPQGCKAVVLDESRHHRKCCFNPNYGEKGPRGARRVFAMDANGHKVEVKPRKKQTYRCDFPSCKNRASTQMKALKVHLRRMHNMAEADCEVKAKELAVKERKEDPLVIEEDKKFLEGYKKFLHGDISEGKEAADFMEGRRYSSAQEKDIAEKEIERILEKKMRSVLRKYAMAENFIKKGEFSYAKEHLNHENFIVSLKKFKKVVRIKSSSAQTYLQNLVPSFQYCLDVIYFNDSTLRKELFRIIKHLRSGLAFNLAAALADADAVREADKKRAFDHVELSLIQTLPTIQLILIKLFFLNAERARKLTKKEYRDMAVVLCFLLIAYNGPRPQPVTDLLTTDVLKPYNRKDYVIKSSGGDKTKGKHGSCQFSLPPGLFFCLYRFALFARPEYENIHKNSIQEKFVHHLFLDQTGGLRNANKYQMEYKAMMERFYGPFMKDKDVNSRVLRKMVSTGYIKLFPQNAARVASTLHHSIEVAHNTYQKAQRDEDAVHVSRNAMAYNRMDPIQKVQVQAHGGHKPSDLEAFAQEINYQKNRIEMEEEFMADMEEEGIDMEHFEPVADLWVDGYFFDDEMSVGPDPDDPGFPPVELIEMNRTSAGNVARGELREIRSGYPQLRTSLIGVDIEKLSDQEAIDLAAQIYPEEITEKQEKQFNESYPVKTQRLIFCPIKGPILKGKKLKKWTPNLQLILEACGVIWGKAIFIRYEPQCKVPSGYITLAVQRRGDLLYKLKVSKGLIRPGISEQVNSHSEAEDSTELDEVDKDFLDKDNNSFDFETCDSGTFPSNSQVPDEPPCQVSNSFSNLKYERDRNKVLTPQDKNRKLRRKKPLRGRSKIHAHNDFSSDDDESDDYSVRDTSDGEMVSSSDDDSSPLPQRSHKSRKSFSTNENCESEAPPKNLRLARSGNPQQPPSSSLSGRITLSDANRPPAQQRTPKKSHRKADLTKSRSYFLNMSPEKLEEMPTPPKVGLILREYEERAERGLPPMLRFPDTQNMPKEENMLLKKTIKRFRLKFKEDDEKRLVFTPKAAKSLVLETLTGLDRQEALKDPNLTCTGTQGPHGGWLAAEKQILDKLYKPMALGQSKGNCTLGFQVYLRFITSKDERLDPFKYYVACREEEQKYLMKYYKAFQGRVRRDLKRKRPMGYALPNPKKMRL